MYQSFVSRLSIICGSYVSINGIPDTYSYEIMQKVKLLTYFLMTCVKLYLDFVTGYYNFSTTAIYNQPHL